MASPQIENGYTKIANELLEALVRFNGTGSQFRVMLLFIRKIYGYREKGRHLETKDIVEGSGMNKSQCIRTINELLVANQIIRSPRGNLKGYKYSIQKDYTKWKRVKRKIEKGRHVETKRSPRGDQKGRHAETKPEVTPIIYKERKKDKETTLQVPCNSTEKNNTNLRLSNLLFSLMLENNPKAKKPNLNKWADDIEKLIRIDKRTPVEIEHVIKWTQKNHFESTNILSTRKLRDRFDQLWLKSNKKSEKKLHSRLSEVGERWLEK